MSIRPWVVLFLSIATASATAANADCDCSEYPYKPPSCFDECAANLLSWIGPKLQEILGIEESLANRLRSLQDGLLPMTSLNDYAEKLTEEQWKRLSAALDPERTEVLKKATESVAKQLEKEKKREGATTRPYYVEGVAINQSLSDLEKAASIHRDACKALVQNTSKVEAKIGQSPSPADEQFEGVRADLAILSGLREECRSELEGRGSAQVERTRKRLRSRASPDEPPRVDR